jgi:UPF0755 protein
MKKFRLLASGLLMAGLILLCAAGWKVMWSPNTAFEENEKFFYIRTGTTYNQLLEKLRHHGIVRNSKTFRWTARWYGYTTVLPGKYLIKKSSDNAELVKLLRDAVQTHVNIQLAGTPTPAALCAKLARQLEKDSVSFAAVLMNADTMARYGANAYTFPALLPARAYSFQWNVSPSDLLQAIIKEGQLYWTADRLQKASLLSLTTLEVATLASIVRGETVQSDEAPVIAGLYLNRLRKGMKLQSDPTVTFARGLTQVQRVLNDDLEVISPYNTYKVVGLPPGPISLPEPAFMDAVLNAANHNYLFMCAKPGGSGYHDFTASDVQHMANARAYRQWLDQQNIRR